MSCRRLIFALLLAYVGALSPAVAQQLLASDPLLVAAFNGDTLAARRLLLGGKSPNLSDNDNRTALMWAVIAGRLETASEIVGFKPRLEAADVLGNTALFYAADRGEPELIDLLVKGGAPVDAENRQGATPLIAAARAGHDLAIRRLLAAKADPRRTDYSGKSALDWAREGRSPSIVRLLEAAQR